MNEKFLLQNSVSKLVGSDASIVEVQGISGGSIHQVRKVRLADGECFAAKIACGKLGRQMLQAERDGLNAIAATGAFRTPKVLGDWLDDASDRSVMLLEWIEPGTRGELFGVRLAEGLWRLHQSIPSKGQYGFADRNFIGSTPQPNRWTESWVDFWREQRLIPQLELGKLRGAPIELLKFGNRLAGRLDQWLDARPPTGLLHGDLWSGNVLADQDGEPVLIDPAVYYGASEAELGMTTLFGDFGESFLQEHVRLFQSGDEWQDRIAIYRLYHLLNHFNLFGSGYLGGCLEILKRLAR